MLHWRGLLLSLGLAVLLPLYCVGRVDKSGNFFGWVDPDTLTRHYQTKSYTNGEQLELVMSDEFEKDGRLFKDGADPMWTALEKSDDDQTAQGKKSLQYYSANMVTTKDGKLVITTSDEDTTWHQYNPYKKKVQSMSRHFKSGMLMGWDKFCFTGGVIEVDLKLPGRSDIGGLWPAVWLFGNLGRATYEQSTNKMWPWSYKSCDRAKQNAQEISGCDVTEHYDMHSFQGRGATEIDIMEVMPGPSTPLPVVKQGVHRPYNSMTLQLAPGIPASSGRPFVGTLPEWGFQWYNNLTYGHNVSINPFFYGTFLGPTKPDEPIHRTAAEAYQCDAIGSMGQLDDSQWHRFSTFRLEWEPGDDGYVRWYVDGEFKFGIEGRDIRNVSGASIPSEPSYIILNTAISTSWGFPTPPWGCDEYDCKTASGRCGFNRGFCETLPAEFLVDSVRVYQRIIDGDSSSSSSSGDANASSDIDAADREGGSHTKTTARKPNPNPKPNSHTLGCNPQDYPTKKFIKAHASRYTSGVLSGDDDGSSSSSGGGSISHGQEAVPKKPVQHGGAPCTAAAAATTAQPHAASGASGGSGSGTKPKKPSDDTSAEGKGKGSTNACGGAGAGFCSIFGKCTCQGYWTGPNCKVPTYQNDFPDWEDAEEWMWRSAVPNIALPRTIWIVSGVFAILLVLGARLLVRRRNAAFSKGGSSEADYSDGSPVPGTQRTLAGGGSNASRYSMSPLAVSSAYTRILDTEMVGYRTDRITGPNGGAAYQAVGMSSKGEWAGADEERSVWSRVWSMVSLGYGDPDPDNEYEGPLTPSLSHTSSPAVNVNTGGGREVEGQGQGQGQGEGERRRDGGKGGYQYQSINGHTGFRTP